MASSRWKRFAFFERHTLNVPNDVLEDLIPIGKNSQRQSVRSLAAAAATSLDSSVCMCVTTAGLPAGGTTTTTITKKSGGDSASEDALEAMWKSLTACHLVPETTTMREEKEETVEFPANSNSGNKSNSASSSSATALDGLVLAFLASNESPYVHCVDLTIRCNPPLTTEELQLEDMDGWRGYVAPLMQTNTSPSNTTTAAEALSGGESILDIATCRVPPPKQSEGSSSNKEQSYTALHLACLSHARLVIWEDPHLHLSCRQPLAKPTETKPSKVWSTHLNTGTDGDPVVLAMQAGLAAVGTNQGAVLVWTFRPHQPAVAMRKYLRIPPPPTEGHRVVSVHLSCTETKAYVFVTYDRPHASTVSDNDQDGMATAGLCCYEFPMPSGSSTLSAPSARHDLDGRHVVSARLVDAGAGFLTVARPDGLYSYSSTERIAVAPIDGTKLAMAAIPPPVPAIPIRETTAALSPAMTGYALVASTDEKSGRDAVDIYDATNKLVAFHFLLSPGHKAIQASGVTTVPSLASDGSWKGGRSSALVFTSGGSLVTLTEKLTTEKVDLLVQKNLYSAAVVVAYADPSFPPTEITNLYRRYAEHLYRKGDFSSAMEQYIHTIGSLESSHVIFRYLDAPKIPLLVKYLERLRAKHLATVVHNELLKTCYLKLNDTEAADAIAPTASSSRSLNKASLNTILANLSNNPKEALATICTLEAPQAAEVLVIHGVSLARAMPRETAGVVISLCVGTYSARALAGLSTHEVTDLKKMVEYTTDDRAQACEPYPIELFASAFLEHPKLLRLILAHCNRNKCPISPSLRRTLLELTLDEWNQSKRTGDTEAQKLRYKEAIAALTDSHCREIGDYDALVIVQLAGFSEGELILYERLQMTPMLLERYARDGSEKSRRQMLALCQSDPEVLADVLGHFVELASGKLGQKRGRKAGDTNSTGTAGGTSDDEDEDDEVEEILEDIQEALTLAKRQAVLPPVRIARILAGEGTGQFSDAASDEARKRADNGSIPLSVALDFVGNILEESRQEITRLKSEVEEYNELCNSMEMEIDSLLRSSHALPAVQEGEANDVMAARLNIDEVYWKALRSDDNDFGAAPGDRPLEAFWRDMTQSEDTFETVCRYYAKGVIQ
eukprot:scaffold448_cov156-Amphora_coffeaeformis.AAC.3